MLSDADIASLSEAQRATLARHLAGERGPSGVVDLAQPLTDHAEPVAEASAAVVASLLDQRAAIIAEQLSVVQAREAKESAECTAVLDAVTGYARACPIAELSDGGYRRTLYSLHSTARDGLCPSYAHLRGYAADAVGRSAELAEYLAAQAAERAAIEASAKAAREQQAAAARAEMESVLTAQAPELLPVWRAGRADESAVGRACRAWLRAQIAVPTPMVDIPDSVRPASICARASTCSLTPEQWAHYEQIRAAVETTAEAHPDMDLTVQISESHGWREADEDERGDDDGEVRIDGPACARISADIGGMEIVIATALVAPTGPAALCSAADTASAMDPAGMRRDQSDDERIGRGLEYIGPPEK
jgi:ribosome modulation factor